RNRHSRRTVASVQPHKDSSRLSGTIDLLHMRIVHMISCAGHRRGEILLRCCKSLPRSGLTGRRDAFNRLIK
ncbi:hypothetical protein AB9U18_25405, partial [Novosphingobium sp. NRRL B-2648]|uniref:hypothetical protein n=1 Tax=Novosphingobium sp. NRRL B-2648 TaxID=3230802 RepID=UPI0035179729